MKTTIDGLKKEHEDRWYSKVADVCSAYANLLCVLGKPICGIATLDRFIQILQNEKSEFTAAHTEYARLCLTAKCYQHSLKHLSTQILQVKQVKKEKFEKSFGS